MNNYPKLKLRKDKQNSQGRQIKTQYQPRQKELSLKFKIGDSIDSVQITKNTDRSKQLQIKYIPMKGINLTKKLTTQPNNNKKLNKTDKFNAEKLFNYQSLKRKTHKHSQSFAVGIKKQQGKARYAVENQIGNGTFGTVYKARDKKTLDLVAIKKVFQDKKYKNRQLQILKMISHPNILKMRDSFYTFQSQKQYLNVVMDHFPYNLYEFILKNKRKNQISRLNAKIIAYQLFRGLLYLNVEGISHRDIKPQNILINQSYKVVICDFGSAKKLKKGQPNIAYICSRSYRAPQLIFGCTQYSTQIDMWSTGCILVQLLSIEPIFRAKSSSQHLIQIIKVLGTPTTQQIFEMNEKSDIDKFKFPKIPRKKIAKVLDHHSYGQQFNDLIEKILRYSPYQRLTPFQALAHPFFDELRQQMTHKRIKRQYNLDLFNFKITKEKQIPNMQMLTPPWYK